MIASFYKDRTLLITGGTGFVGQALITKLLRDVFQIRKIYILIRPKKNSKGEYVAAAERLAEEFFSSTVFDIFKKVDPDGFAAAVQKVEAVEGDILEEDMGLDEDLLVRLQGEVDLVINSAATVVFDEPLDLSLKLNTKGPLALLEFARSCEKKAIFLHVSTAYVNGQRPGKILEEPLPINQTMLQLMEADGEGANFDPEEEIDRCQTYCEKKYKEAASKTRQDNFKRAISAQERSHKLSSKRLEQLLKDRTKGWIKEQLVQEGMQRAKAMGWNDVYTFTKALGEMILIKKQGDVPLVIVRPSIIESSLADPEPGWITGLKVTDPLIAAYGRGLMPDFPAVPDRVIDIIPVDMVVNAIVIAALSAKAAQVEVFQIASSAENPVKVATLFDNMRGYFLRYPMLDRAGKAPLLKQWSYPSLKRFRRQIELKYMLPLRLKEWVLERLPQRWVRPQKKRLLSALKVRIKRVIYYSDIYYPYTQLNCSYSTERIRTLFNELSPAEQECFNIDVKRIDWDQYIQRIHIPGLRRFVLKDQSSETLFPEAPTELGQEEERWQVERDIASIPELVRWACARYPEQIAFQCQDGGETWQRFTYQQVQQRVDGLASYWQEVGLSAGQNLLLCGESSPEWAISYFAASSIGISIVPLNPQIHEEEFWALADFNEVQSVVASEDIYNKLSEQVIQSRRETGFYFFNMDNFGLPYGGERVDEPPAITGEWEPNPVGGDQVASIIYLVGTRPEPRGVMLTHQNFMSNVLSLAEVQRMHESDNLLSVLPMHDTLEFCSGLLLTILGGATTTFLKTVNSREICDSIQTHGITAMVAGPNILQALSERLGRFETVGKGQMIAALQKLRLVVCGGAPIAKGLFETYKKWDINLYQVYGLTEAGSSLCVNSPSTLAGVGAALPGQEITIDRPDAQGIGEVMTRGANVMKGYFKNPQLTAQVLNGGWLKNGDIGYLDKDGILHITGRSKHLINNGMGKKVYPEEVEAQYGKLPYVDEFGVVGVEALDGACEEIHGVAFVKGIDEVAAVDLEQEIRQYLHKISCLLPLDLRVQHVHIRSQALPRLADGTLDRVSLVATIELIKQNKSEAAVSIYLSAWESTVYTQVGHMIGLAAIEVEALAYESISTILDLLMWVEFSAWVRHNFSISLEKVDRRRSLKNIIDQIAAGGDKNAIIETQATNFWSVALTGDQGIGSKVNNKGVDQPGRFGGALLRPYFSTQAVGLHNLPQDRPYLIAANHKTHLDAPCIGAAIRSQVEHIILAASQPYFLAPPKRLWLYQRLMEVIPCGRDSDLQDALAQLAVGIKVRRPIVIFPEGNRSLNGQLKLFKATAALLAYELDVPIVPAYITYRGQSGTAAESKPHQVHLGVPLEMAAFRESAQGLSAYETYHDISNALRNAIETLRRLA